jgi:DNA polymerase Ligase (LigD)
MPRFVVLTHDHPTLHWDLMLEEGDGLRTWRLADPPDTDGPIAAEALPDHRVTYLDYEGPVSGGRGMVKQWDHGTYEVIDSTEGQLVVRFAGRKLSGTAAITQTRNGPACLFRRFVAEVGGS